MMIIILIITPLIFPYETIKRRSRGTVALLSLIMDIISTGLLLLN